MAEDEKKESNTWLHWLIGGTLAIGLVGQIIKPADKAEPKAPKAATAPVQTGPSDWQRMAAAETDIKARLRDPKSAEFSRMKLKGGVVCGYVNSRNGFGGMTGPKPFLTRAGILAVVEDDMPEGEFQKSWDTLC